MRNKRNWLGMLAVVLLFGMAIIGCSDKSTDEEPHQITITGLDGKTGDYIIWLSSFLDTEGYSIEAHAIGMISGNSLTASLMSAIDNSAWMGSGNYYIYLNIDHHDYFYTNGQTFAQLGIVTENDFNTKMPKYNITGTTTTIAFDKFYDFTDFYE